MLMPLRMSMSMMLLVFVLPLGARAAIISTSGAVVVVPAPADLREGAYESDTQIRAIEEQQGVLLQQGLALDITLPGVYPSGGTPSLTPGTIAAGTRVNSYLLHFDTELEQSVQASGSVTFDESILGLAVLPATLLGSDGLTGLAGVMYPQGDQRGFELEQTGEGGGLDSVTLSTDRRTVSFDLRNGTRVDQVRVITAVPEPAAIVLFAIGAGVFTVGRRRYVSRLTCSGLVQFR